MKISIVTVCYNAAATIEETLLSVRSQRLAGFAIEHILVDGGSTDTTMAIVARYRDPSLLVISEPDHGIFDAMNKGIALATGEIIGILNADDVYASDNVLAKIVAVFAEPAIAACYGDLVYVKNQNLARIVRHWAAGPFQPGAFARGWCPPHPTFFVRLDLYQRFGGFELHFGLAADFELMLRFLEKRRVNTAYIPEILVRMRLGGASNKSLGNILRQNREVLRAFRVNQIELALPSFLARKFWVRLRQFFSRPPVNGS